MVYKYLQLHITLKNTSATEPKKLDNAKDKQKST